MLYLSGGLLIRWVDDYLYLNSNMEMIKEFEINLSIALDKYHSVVAPNKTKCILNHGDQIVDNFHWCGIEVDINTMNVSSSFEKYNDIDFGDSISKIISLKKFFTCLVLTCSSKAHALFLDDQINSYDIIKSNIHKVIGLVIEKLVFYLKYSKLNFCNYFDPKMSLKINHNKLMMNIFLKKLCKYFIVSFTAKYNKLHAIKNLNFIKDIKQITKDSFNKHLRLSKMPQLEHLNHILLRFTTFYTDLSHLMTIHNDSYSWMSYTV